MEIEDLSAALEAAQPEDRECMIEDWLAKQPEDLRDQMRPYLYESLTVMDDAEYVLQDNFGKS